MIIKSETIAAIATALSNSGISIIRMSGPDSIAIADKIFTPKKNNKKVSEMKSHTIHYGYIMDEKDIVDEVLLVIMRAPNSYTKEDVIEIDCHGGVVVTKKILDIVLKNGAIAAQPGEFTKRAFLNGRIDLSQAEAVMDVINSKNEYALKSSINQLKGSVVNKISEIRNVIIKDVAFIEAALDDPEHMSIDGYTDTILINIEKCMKDIKKLIDSSDDGRIIKEGINTVIVGKPNAGKSSFLNALIGEDRAIVTDVAGTTRDVIKEEININGILLNIMDTAGIHDTDDYVEKIGIEKTMSCVDEADLVIYIVDGSTNLDENDFVILDNIKDKNALILLNKMDLDMITDSEEISKHTDKKVINISAKKSEGINEFEECLKEMFFKGNIDFNDEVFITNARQKSALIDAYDSLIKVKESIDNNMPEDFLSIDMMGAYESLGMISGESLEDDLVNTIFKEFCMGK